LHGIKWVVCCFVVVQTQRVANAHQNVDNTRL
jgi:hypothetical protein